MIEARKADAGYALITAMGILFLVTVIVVTAGTEAANFVRGERHAESQTRCALALDYASAWTGAALESGTLPIGGPAPSFADPAQQRKSIDGLPGAEFLVSASERESVQGERIVIVRVAARCGAVVRGAEMIFTETGDGLKRISWRETGAGR